MTVTSGCMGAEFLATHDKLHLLINNAAIMATPYATVEWSGVTVEKQFATNHLGPFLLTGLLQKVLEATPGARVINHSSSASDGCQVGNLSVYGAPGIVFTERQYVKRVRRVAAQRTLADGKRLSAREECPRDRRRFGDVVQFFSGFVCVLEKGK